jgi:predicted signal transduction protein with EAL and GGDEF domain
MAESLDLQVIAEGIETEEQFNLLCEMGCGFAQGHYFCAPMSAAQIGIGGPVVDLDGDPPGTGDAPQGWLQALKVDND